MEPQLLNFQSFSEPIPLGAFFLFLLNGPQYCILPLLGEHPEGHAHTKKQFVRHNTSTFADRMPDCIFDTGSGSTIFCILRHFGVFVGSNSMHGLELLGWDIYSTPGYFTAAITTGIRRIEIRIWRVWFWCVAAIIRPQFHHCCDLQGGKWWPVLGLLCYSMSIDWIDVIAA